MTCLNIFIQLTLAHIRMTYTTTEKNLLYNTKPPIKRHYMCIGRHKRINQILHNRKQPTITQHMRNYWHVWHDLSYDSIRATIRHIIFSV
jgi:hypothetical protein